MMDPKTNMTNKMIH